MGRMKELNEILGELTDTLSELREFISLSYEEEQPVTAEPKPTLSKEDVRKVLAEWMNRDKGKHKPRIKELLRKYSESGNLSGVKPEDYQALLAELEATEDAT